MTLVIGARRRHVRCVNLPGAAGGTIVVETPERGPAVVNLLRGRQAGAIDHKNGAEELKDQKDCSSNNDQRWGANL